MSVSFNEIPMNIRVPSVLTEYDASKAVSGPGVQPIKALLVGQRLTAGSVAALTPIRITSAAQAKNYFGEGSILHRQAIAWFADNTITELWAVAFDDPSGSAAAGADITFTGPATAAGTLSLYIGGERVQIGVTSGDTAAEIATAVAAAIEAASNLPVSAEVNGSDDTQVDLTALNKGTLGNEIDIRFNYFEGEETPAGVGHTIVAFSGGSGVPDFDTLWPVLGDEHYNAMVIPYIDSASLADIKTETLDRAGPLRAIETMVFAAKDDTHANLGTFGDSHNNQFISVICPGGDGSPTPGFEIGANYGAVAIEALAIDPARPLQTLALSHVKAPVTTARFTFEERNLLLFDGIATAVVNSGGTVQIERAITLYKENALGADDVSYLDVNTLFTLSYIRWSVTNRILLKFPRHKLANDGTRFGFGQKVVTPKVMKAELIALFTQWEELALVEGVQQFVSDLVVERNSSDVNRLDIILPPDVVNQLRVTAIQIQFRL